ncbi:hypothetical protein GCM10010398_74360 [Streptomyces fimbriatus]
MLRRSHGADRLSAVSEATGGPVRHGGGQDVLRLRRSVESVIVEARDRGGTVDPPVGRRRPGPLPAVGGRGVGGVPTP